MLSKAQLEDRALMSMLMVPDDDEDELMEVVGQLVEWLDVLTTDYGKPSWEHAKAYTKAVAWLRGKA